LLGASLTGWGCHDPHISGPLDQRAYVWQRQGTPTVLEAVKGSGRFSRLLFLAAEIDPNSPGRPEFLLETFDYVRQSPREIGLCIRIRELHGRFAIQPDALNAVLATLRELQNRARTSGIEVSEWQLDYDAPESGLEDYAALVRAARAVASPLTITALPTWLKRTEAFAELVAAADGYVLQLHGWDLEASRPEAMRVLDQSRLERWVDEGDPFTNFVAMHDKGSIVTGNVKSLDGKGAVITLSGEVEGYLRASELSRDRVEDMRQHLKEGDSVNAMIINVDRKNRSINLSIKAKDNAEEGEAMRQISSDNQGANTGTTNLGALLKAKLSDTKSNG
jgi:predicted RNA-binding protein with RPS1 domain